MGRKKRGRQSSSRSAHRPLSIEQLEVRDVLNIQRDVRDLSIDELATEVGSEIPGLAVGLVAASDDSTVHLIGHSWGSVLGAHLHVEFIRQGDDELLAAFRRPYGSWVSYSPRQAVVDDNWDAGKRIGMDLEFYFSLDRDADAGNDLQIVRHYNSNVLSEQAPEHKGWSNDPAVDEAAAYFILAAFAPAASYEAAVCLNSWDEEQEIPTTSYVASFADAHVANTEELPAETFVATLSADAIVGLSFAFSALVLAAFCFTLPSFAAFFVLLGIITGVHASLFLFVEGFISRRGEVFRVVMFISGCLLLFEVMKLLNSLI